MKGFCRVAFLAVLSLLCFASLGGITQSIALTDEEIHLHIFPYSSLQHDTTPYGGMLYLWFVFRGVDGPLDASDFTSEPTFSSMSISCSYSPDNSTNNIQFHVVLDTSVVGVSAGRVEADIMKAKVEDLFEVALPYTGNSTISGLTYYRYEIDECPAIQKFRDLFMQLKPSTGFGQVITPALIGNKVSISFSLGMDEGLPKWSMKAFITYPDYFPYGSDREFTVSLKALAGYSGTIQPSPEAAASTLEIFIIQSIEYRLLSLETTPPQMQMQQSGKAPDLTWVYSATIKDSGVEDLAIHFRIVPPPSTDPTNIIVLIGIVTVAILSVTVFIIKKRRNMLK